MLGLSFPSYTAAATARYRMAQHLPSDNPEGRATRLVIQEAAGAMGTSGGHSLLYVSPDIRRALLLMRWPQAPLRLETV